MSNSRLPPFPMLLTMSYGLVTAYPFLQLGTNIFADHQPLSRLLCKWNVATPPHYDKGPGSQLWTFTSLHHPKLYNLEGGANEKIFPLKFLKGWLLTYLAWGKSSKHFPLCQAASSRKDLVASQAFQKGSASMPLILWTREPLPCTLGTSTPYLLGYTRSPAGIATPLAAAPCSQMHTYATPSTDLQDFLSTRSLNGLGPWNFKSHHDPLARAITIIYHN